MKFNGDPTVEAEKRGWIKRQQAAGSGYMAPR